MKNFRLRCIFQRNLVENTDEKQFFSNNSETIEFKAYKCIDDEYKCVFYGHFGVYIIFLSALVLEI